MDRTIPYHSRHIIVGTPKALRRGAKWYACTGDVKTLAEDAMVLTESSSSSGAEEGKRMTTGDFRSCIIAQTVQRGHEHLRTNVWFRGKRLGWRPTKDAAAMDIVIKLRELLAAELDKDRERNAKRSACIPF